MTTIYIKEGTELPKRVEFDVYETEKPLIRAALAKLPKQILKTQDLFILDIGCGSGRWGEVYKELQPKCTVHGIEIRDIPDNPAYDKVYHGNFADIELDRKYNLIIGNPPYKFAEEIIRYGWQYLANNGQMAMLLRLAFQAGSKRAKDLWQNIYPWQVSVCSRRPSFLGDGGTNGTDYGIFYWAKNELGNTYGTPGQWFTNLLEFEREIKN